MSELLNPSLSAILAAGERRVQPRIFLVEDEAIFALDLSEQLADAGYEVCGTADNGEAALAGIRSTRPDLVLMDVMIKGAMDGIETAMRLSEVGAPPVIFLTAFSDQRTIDRATRATPYGYLTKPVQLRELHAGIEVALYRRDAEKRVRQSDQWLNAALSCLPEAVICTDAQGQIRFVNALACEMLQGSADQLVGAGLSGLVRLEDADTGVDLIAAPPMEGPARHTKAVLVLQDGQRVAVQLAHTAMRDEVGGLLGCVRVLSKG